MCAGPERFSSDAGGWPCGATLDLMSLVAGSPVKHPVSSLCLRHRAVRVCRLQFRRRRDSRLDRPAPTSLDEVVVVANRAPEALSKVGNSVTVLTDADIKASRLPMLSDVLAQTPGSRSRLRRRGQPTSVFIRGAESDQTVVLIDGVQIYRPCVDIRVFRFPESPVERRHARRDLARRSIDPVWQSGLRRRHRHHHRSGDEPVAGQLQRRGRIAQFRRRGGLHRG